MGKRGRGEIFLTADSTFRKKRFTVPKRRREEHDQIIPSRIDSKVLKEILLQQKEIADEVAAKGNDPFSSIAEEDEIDSDDDALDLSLFRETQNEYTRECEEIDEEEERILDSFISKEIDPQQMLADTILSKIREKCQQVSSETLARPKLDRSIIDLYKGVGQALSKLTNGKLPKAFRHIPSLKNWEDLLSLTEPENWSAYSVYAATKIFASNLPRNEAERFYSLVLLPRVREDIQKNKRLHPSLFQALKKSIYKPKAFNKGILFPLCKSGTCTLREAFIIGGVIRKVSIPSHHPGAALLKLAEMEYCGTTSYFIKVLLDKRYCLAYRVLDGLVAHFMRFLEDPRVMPVIWHQSLLSFVQWYRNELTQEDKDKLDCLLQVKRHYLVTPEIERELKNSRNRGEKEEFTSVHSIIEDRFDIPDVPIEED